MQHILWIIMPAYNEEELIEISFLKINEILNTLINKQKISQLSRILYVDDGSTDKTWDIIEELSKKQDKIKGLKLTKNYGQQQALFAGMKYAYDNNTDIVITLDCDLQDDISMIEEFINQYQEGYDAIFGVHNIRTSDTFLKRFTANIFYKIIKSLNGDILENHSEFRLLNRKCLDKLINSDNIFFLRGIALNLTDNYAVIKHERKKRFCGQPKYTFKKSLHLAISALFYYLTKYMNFNTFINSSIKNTNTCTIEKFI